ncbi:MAG: hypothetical protein OEY01_03015 [Desulfobulbaceae bacterium]|nr:hypothetical protein [Desulfobulbaceae bacterium]HIJ78261.1 hypothetical protein [Deltaproteobacteria bacterium]
MPIEDLSQGVNGYNQSLTVSLITALRQGGHTVLSEDAVIDFMVRNRIRWLGYLDSTNVVKLREELGVDFILFGSVNQLRQKAPSAIGLSAMLIRTADVRMIWAGSGELCTVDVQHLLGLAEPQTFADIEAMALQRLLAAMPKSFTTITSEQVQRLVDNVSLAPAVLRPGGLVTCRVKLFGSPAVFGKRKVMLSVGTREVEAVFREDAELYEAVWRAPDNDGRYSVTLNVSGAGADGENIFVGSYLVDGTVPQLSLQVLGPKFKDRVVLRDKVYIVPILLDSELISHWKMTILDKDGVVLMADHGNGMPERLVWHGKLADGHFVPDGDYTIELSAWDRAENEVTVPAQVQVFRRAPELEIAVELQDKDFVIDLRHGNDVPLSYWRAEILSQDGVVIREATGDRLPYSFILSSTSGQNQGKLRLVLVAQDIFGGKITRKFEDLLGMIPQDSSDQVEEEVIAPEVGGIDDF